MNQAGIAPVGFKCLLLQEKKRKDAEERKIREVKQKTRKKDLIKYKSFFPLVGKEIKLQ